MNSEMEHFLAMHSLMRKLMSTTFKTGNPLLFLSGIVISMVSRDLLMRKALGKFSKAYSRGFHNFPHEDSYRNPHEESLGEEKERIPIPFLMRIPIGFRIPGVFLMRKLMGFLMGATPKTPEDTRNSRFFYPRVSS